MKIRTEHVGTLVSWPISGGDTTTVRIASSGPDCIAYVCTDGYREAAFSSFALSDDITKRWRPATPGEQAEYARLYQGPRPNNWD
ncbi:hypothetical protein ACFWXK_10265 [Streptomyces sp. NPDC059070]|uniref:hypothetical protein n=1 Tax=Streptomyces sp. NPDC059070 TaxID=3346713 RepID=UPI00369CA514